MKRAFTLIEIAIVVLIIGVLTSIAIPMFSKARKKARINEAQADIEMLTAAVRQLAWDTGKWPGGADRLEVSAECWDLSKDNAGLLGNDGTFDTDKWDGPYTREVKTDPWGNPYFFDPDYYPNGMGSNPKLAIVGSFGPNGSGKNVYDSDNIYSTIEVWD